jgi:hypothetical protein
MLGFQQAMSAFQGSVSAGFLERPTAGAKFDLGSVLTAEEQFFGKRICDQDLLRLQLEPSLTRRSLDRRWSTLLIGNISNLRITPHLQVARVIRWFADRFEIEVCIWPKQT